VAVLAGGLWVATPGSVEAQKGNNLTKNTVQQLLQCSLNYTPSRWYFSSLRTVLVKQKSFGIYRAGWRSLMYAMRVPQCISRHKGNRRLARKGARAVSALAGLPLYGPQQGKQKHSRTINYYNPDLIQWLANNIPSNQTKIWAVTPQALYKTMFQRLIRITAYTYLHLQRVGYQRLVKQYGSVHVPATKATNSRARWAQRTRAKRLRRRLQRRFQKLVMDPILRGPKGRFMAYYYHAGRAAMFWLRRGLGGSHKDVWQLVKAILKEYDPNFLSTITDPRKPITLKLPKLPPPKVYTLGPSDAGQLQNTINKASPHSKIKLGPGTYRFRRALRIHNKVHLTLQGAGRGKTRIIITKRSSDVISIRNAQHITIQSLSARHTNPPKGMTCSGAVVSVGRGQKIWIHDAELNGSGAFGVRAWSTRDLVITNNSIHSNTNAALQIGGSKGVHVEGNVIKNNASTLLCYYGWGINMLNNTITNNKGHQLNSAILTNIREKLKDEK